MTNPSAWPVMYACLGLLAACGDDAPTKHAQSGERRERVVLITLDTVRFDAFGAMDSAETMLPALREYAQRGVVYDRFYTAAPTTQPAHASLFTGLHPWEHGVVRNGLVLADEYTTVAERFQSEGWETRAIVASFPVHAKFGFAQGFDVYDDDFTFERKRMPETWIGTETTGEHFYSIAESITDKALDAMDRMNGERQFLWVHYFDAHSPYGDLADDQITLHRLRVTASEHPEELDAKLARAKELYREDTLRLDSELRRLLDRIHSEREKFVTHVLITADHGESFGEDGALGHDSRLTPEQIHIPFILVSPRVKPGVCLDPAGSVDAHATLESLGQLAPFAQQASHGRDLSAPNQAVDESQAFGIRHYDPEQGLPRFFMVGQRREAGGSGIVSGNQDALYVDDLESRKLAPGAQPETRARFSEFASALEQATATSIDDDETRRTLGAMGYVGEE